LAPFGFGVNSIVKLPLLGPLKKTTTHRSRPKSMCKKHRPALSRRFSAGRWDGGGCPQTTLTV